MPSLKTLELKPDLGVAGISLVDFCSGVGKEFLWILLETHVATVDELPWFITGRQ